MAEGSEYLRQVQRMVRRSNTKLRDDVDRYIRPVGSAQPFGVPGEERKLGSRKGVGGGGRILVSRRHPTALCPARR